MQLKKRLTMLLMIMLLLCRLPVTALAAVPDLNRRGSITVTIQDDGQAVAGGTLTLYRVGEIHQDNGNYSFRPTGDFADCGLEYTDVQSPALAQALAEFAQENGIEGMETIAVNASGTVVFDDLEPGLYLIVQEKAAPGYYPALPFLVSIPYLQDGEYNYHVDATPKVEIDPEPPTEPTDPTDPTNPDDTNPTNPDDTNPTNPDDTDPTNPDDTNPTNPDDTNPTNPDDTNPTNPDDTTPTDPDDTTPTEPEESETTKPTKPTKPTETTEPKIPQTGQTNWPVPVLASLGMLLFAIGWVLYSGKRDQDAQ